MNPTHLVRNSSTIPTPALIFYEDAIVRNTLAVLAKTGDPGRLRPHVKTHKTKEICALQIALGVTKFKCATLVEARMAAEAGASEVMVAYPLVGPNIGLFLDLMERYPLTRFQAVFDNAVQVRTLAVGARTRNLEVETLIDIDAGMHRTGVLPEEADDLYALTTQTPGLVPGGIHGYDGQNHQTALAERTTAADQCYRDILALRQRLEARGLSVPRVVLGGTPPYTLYAARDDVEVSPGTCFLHDWGYTTKFPDQSFEAAALVLTRVVSVHPAQGTFTLDLGHKAVAADPPGARGRLFGRPEDFARPLFQSEEHWVWQLGSGVLPSVGDEFYVQPTHICPTVNLHPRAHVVDASGHWTKDWAIVGRDRA